MSVKECLKGLPSYDKLNFSRYQPDCANKNASTKKTPVYIPVKDHPEGQVIKTEKTNILLKYLHKEWSRKRMEIVTKRSHPDDEPETSKRSRSQARN